MSPTDEKELMDRVRRIESRMVAGFQAMGIDLMELVRQSRPELHIDPMRGHYAEVYTLDIPIARIRKAIRDAWPEHKDPVPVFFEGNMIAAVQP